MKKWILVFLLALVPSAVHAQITVPNTLQAGQVIRAAELNTNFSTLGDRALDRVSGGTVEGNLTVNDTITIDGVDISAFLQSTGEVRSQTAGTVASPSFSRSGDTSTGIYFPNNSELGISLAGTSRLTLTASGLTVFGVNIIGSDGKIPAISSTYFTSLSGANLTSLNASNISSGTLGDGRLSSNVPLKDAVTNTFTGDIAALGVEVTDVVTSTFQLGTSTTSGYVLTADASGVGTWQSAGVATGAVPSGMIAIFDTSCPATWTRHTAFDNKFIRGGATYNAAAGGSNTHTHTVDPVSTATTSAGSHAHGAATGAAGSHSHTVDIASTATTSNGAHTHTLSADTTFDGAHSHTGTTDNGGSHSHTVNNV